MAVHDATMPGQTEYLSYCRDSVTLYLKVERNEYFPADNHLHEQLHARLASFLRVLATLASTDPRWNGKAQSNYGRPGFVSIAIDEATIDAPFFLLGDLPPKRLLSQMYRLGIRLRIAASSTICLSGSACYSGSSKYFGDLDYCEYALVNDMTLVSGLLAATKAKSSDICMYSLRLGNQRWQRGKDQEWADLQKKLETQPNLAINASGFRQCLHIASLSAAGVLEATNALLIVHASPRKTGDLDLTFAFQEAPLATDWIPKDLSDPIELGRYIAWLTRQVSTLRAESQLSPLYAIKGARRALALARVLMLGSEAAALAKHLRNADGGKVAAIAGRCSLYAALSGYESVEPFKQYLVGLRETIDTIRGVKVRSASQYSSLSSVELKRLDMHAASVRSTLDKFIRNVQRELGSIPSVASMGA